MRGHSNINYHRDGFVSGINYMYTCLVGGLGILGSITAIQLLIMSKGKEIFPSALSIYL